MNARGKKLTATGASVGAIAVIVAGVWAFGATVSSAAPAPTPSATVQQVAVGTTENGLAAEQETEAAEAVRVEAERVAAEAAATEAARLAAEQTAAQAEAERLAAEQAAQRDQSGGNDGGGGTAPAAPVRCPAGSTANSSDGTNDTSCLPNICFSITVPDAAHPECDVAFRP